MDKTSKTLTNTGRKHIAPHNFAVGPEHPKNKGDKGHFPVHDRSHAENAVARVEGLSKAPSWWSGTLSELKTLVRNKAHGHFKPKTASLSEAMSSIHRYAYGQEDQEGKDLLDKIIAGLL